MTLEYDSRPAWRNFWFAILIELASIPIGIGVIILLSVAIQRHGNRFRIEKGRIESRAGIISKDVRSIRIEHLRDAHLKQSVFQRIFSVGDVAFSSSGQSTQEVIFFGITDPQVLKDKVDEYLHQRSAQV